MGPPPALLVAALILCAWGLDQVNALSGCGGWCRTWDDCQGQLTCTAGKCADDPWIGTKICSTSPKPSPNPSPTPSSGCPAGWQQAVGTLYDSWPKPGSKECVQYSGCKWAGMFKSISPGPLFSGPGTCVASRCNTYNGVRAQCLNGGNGEVACRWPEWAVRTWKMAATNDPATRGTLPNLLGKSLEVMVEGGQRKVRVNVMDICKDSDCNGCCSKNTANNRYSLLDLEKWAAYDLLQSFDPNSAAFDINNVQKPANGGKRPGAQPYVMPLCYKVV